MKGKKQSIEYLAEKKGYIYFCNQYLLPIWLLGSIFAHGELYLI